MDHQYRRAVGFALPILLQDLMKRGVSVGWRCPCTLKIHPLYLNVHTSEGAYQYHNGLALGCGVIHSFIHLIAFLAYNKYFFIFLACILKII
jgi:hypothetical protein